MDQIGSNWIKLDQIGSYWIKLDLIGSKWITSERESVNHGMLKLVNWKKKMHEMYIKLDHIGSYWIKMDHIGHPRYARSRTRTTYQKRESVDHGMLKLVNWNIKSKENC